jgi:hypothetical protein
MLLEAMATTQSFLLLHQLLVVVGVDNPEQLS